jgi:hypothetical protein
MPVTIKVDEYDLMREDSKPGMYINKDKSWYVLVPDVKGASACIYINAKTGEIQTAAKAVPQDTVPRIDCKLYKFLKPLSQVTIS